jgi:hypothetical protein
MMVFYLVKEASSAEAAIIVAKQLRNHCAKQPQLSLWQQLLPDFNGVLFFETDT